MTLEIADPAAVLACALSLHESCVQRSRDDAALNLSDSYNGMDQFLRELMRVAGLFEEWACEHIAFEELGEVWPYLMQDRFGDGCLEVLRADALMTFDQGDCLRVAYQLGLPIRSNGSIVLPADVSGINRIKVSPFSGFRILTVREDLRDGTTCPFEVGDKLFDEDFGKPYFGLYGVSGDGLLEHIADRAGFTDARELLLKLIPGLDLPEQPTTLRRS